MNDKDFENLLQFAYVGGGFVPANEKANELTEDCIRGEVISVLEVTERDLKFHRAYFGLLNYIYDYLPESFKVDKTVNGKLRYGVQKKDFYRWLKHLQKQYKVVYEFSDGTQLVEYDSIAFGNMSQKRFVDYVREQLPWVYEFVIGRYFQEPIRTSIIETIEKDWENLLKKLG